ncbi:MAG: helix-turn-helix domain-containing protein [Acidimicrobiales bacterium]
MSDSDRWRRSLPARAAVHAALGEPLRLAIVDELAVSDRSPKELGERLGVTSNLLAHHLDVLEGVGLVARSVSSGDARRRYVRLVADQAPLVAPPPRRQQREMLFLCTHNSARSQLAAALWEARSGRPARSAGTEPADRVHPGAVRAARRVGLSLAAARPRKLAAIPKRPQVVTVCDRAHEELAPTAAWWHWSIPDPVDDGSDRAFDAVVDELEARIRSVLRGHGERRERA